ncbi:hypothetical protein [Nitrosomonas sp.]|uniref:hypothetical protein n=1 Tax=Nitrosomonas sp. TaxID=42353 RepID=UPI00208AE9E1|nr:hypothetical protein [Nitrosomonas sp.]GJL74233.1 MAG: hypothetical protein NMNS02_03390 [Nitrosomonas sp.]
MKISKLYIFFLLLILATSQARAENTDQGGYPVYNYKDGTLTIPRVDVPGQVGRYQDVVFQFDPQHNTWILQNVESRKNLSDEPKLKLVGGSFIITDPTTSHITLFVIGEYTCGRIGQINQRRVGNLFEIQITKDPLLPTEVCDQKVREFWRILKLDIHRLEAGEYQYSINNGGNTGIFTLPFDTIDDTGFDECGGSPEDDGTVNSCENRIVPF